MRDFFEELKNVEKALKLERKAYEFYEEILQKINDPYVRRILTFLYNEEKHHESILLGIRNNIRKDAMFRADEIHISDAYDTKMFNKEDLDSLNLNPSVVEIVNLAVGYEEKGRSFYSNLALSEKNEYLKKLFENLSKAEEMHKEVISKAGEVITKAMPKA